MSAQVLRKKQTVIFLMGDPFKPKNFLQPKSVFKIDAMVNLRANLTIMSDTERINALETELHQIKAELNRLTLAFNQLTDRAERTRSSAQDAINGVQHDIELIFTNINVPNVVFYPGKRSTID